MTRALLYLRQSDSDGEGERSLSMDSQASVLHEDAARLGWSVVAEVRDADLKGYDEQRPGLLTLYERCRAGDVDLVAFWKLDRLARLLRLQENVLHELDTLGVAVHSNQDPHLGTPLFRHVLGAFNEELTRMISANVRRALRERTRRGLAHGIAPYGYARDEAGLLVPNAAADSVRRIFGWRAEGASLAGIVDRLREAGVPSPTGAAWWPKRSVAYVLNNDAYLGVLRLSEVSIDAAHPALIDPNLWLRSRREPGPVPRRKTAPSWLEGLIVHACGRPMYLSGGSASKPVQSFKCRSISDQMPACPYAPRMIRRDRAEELAWAALGADLAAVRYHRDVARDLRRRYQEASPDAEGARRGAEDRARRLDASRDRWLGLYADGTIDRAKLDRELGKLDGERRGVERMLETLPEPPDAASIESVWRELRDVRALLPIVPDEGKAILLRRLGRAVVSPAGEPRQKIAGRAGRYADAGAVKIDYRPPFAEFFGD